MNAQPALNAEAVQRRLRAIRERVDELSQLEDVTEERLRAEWILRAAVERVLTQVVELAVHVNMHIATAAGNLPPDGYRESFAAAAEEGAISKDLAGRIAPASGLRNILVHQYLDADLSIVADAVGQAVPDFAEYVRQVASWLATHKASRDAGAESLSDG